MRYLNTCAASFRFGLTCLLILAGCDKGPKSMPPGVVAIMHLDAGTDYVFRTEPSDIGGLCEGWNVISIESRRDSAPGMRNLMCWNEVEGLVHTATKNKLTGNPLPMSAINDED